MKKPSSSKVIIIPHPPQNNQSVASQTVAPQVSEMSVQPADTTAQQQPKSEAATEKKN